MSRSTKSTTFREGITQSGQLYKPGLFHNLFTSAGPASLFFCFSELGFPPLSFFLTILFFVWLVWANWQREDRVAFASRSHRIIKRGKKKKKGKKSSLKLCQPYQPVTFLTLKKFYQK